MSASAASSGLSLFGVSTTREDGVTMDFPNASQPHSWHGDGRRHALGHLAVQRKRARPADNPLPRLVEQWRHGVQERDFDPLETGTETVKLTGCQEPRMDGVALQSAPDFLT